MAPQIAPGPWRGWNSVLPNSAPPAKEASSEAGPASVILPPGRPVHTWLCRSGAQISQVRWSGESVGREKGKLATPVFETIHSFKECKKGHIYKNAQICCCCCSVTRSCLTLCDPTDCSTPGFPVLHHLPEFAQAHVMSIESMMPSNHLILCHPFLLLPWTFPSIRVFASGG